MANSRELLKSSSAEIISSPEESMRDPQLVSSKGKEELEDSQEDSQEELEAVNVFPKTVWIVIASFLELPDRLNLGLMSWWLHDLMQLESIRQDLADFEVTQLDISYAGFDQGTHYMLDSRGTARSFLNNKDGSAGLPGFTHKIPNVVSFDSGENSMFFVGKNGTVKTFGMNAHGQMGNGHWFDLRPKVIPNLHDIQQVSCTHGKTYFLDNKGVVRVCGSFQWTGLGIEGGEKQPVPVVIPRLPLIKQVIATDESTVFLARDGEVWACGLIAQRVLGQGKLFDLADPLVKIPGLKDIVSMQQIDSGFILINNEGQVWFAHDGSQGGPYSPKQIEGVKDIVSISHSRKLVPVGNYISEQMFGLTSKGEVWVYGDNAKGQLGVGPVNMDIVKPEQLIGLEGIRKVVCYAGTTLFFGDVGDVWTCGVNNFKDFGLADQSCADKENIFFPVKLNHFPDVDLGSIKVRPYNKQFMCMLDKRGNLLEWEDGKLITPDYLPRINARIAHYHHVLSKYGIGLLDAINYACGDNLENKCFYDAVVGILRSEPLATRFYFMQQLQASPFFNAQEAAAMLFLQKQPLPSTLKLGGMEDCGYEYLIIMKLADIFEYFTTKFAEVQGQPDAQLLGRLNDIIAILKIAYRGNGTRLQETQQHMKDTATDFSWYQVTLFGGYKANMPNLIRRYHNARESLMEAVQLSKHGFAQDGTELFECYIDTVKLFIDHLQNIPAENRTLMMNAVLKGVLPEPQLEEVAKLK